MFTNFGHRVVGTGASVNEIFSPFLSPSGFTLRDLETLPFGIALPIRDAIYHCREQPASDWPEAVCLLIGRQDLSKQACEGNLPKGKSVSVNTESSRFTFSLSKIKVGVVFIFLYVFLQVYASDSFLCYVPGRAYDWPDLSNCKLNTGVGLMNAPFFALSQD